jgi:hypothetical protein
MSWSVMALRSLRRLLCFHGLYRGRGHEHLTIGLVFVGVSLARGCLLGRFFERLGNSDLAADTLGYESPKGSSYSACF